MSYDDELTPQEKSMIVRWSIGGVVGLVVLCLGVWFGLRLVGPQLNLYKANTEKKAAIAEAKAKAESARYEALAEIERAKGVAKANELIAESITPEYIRWLYVDQMDRLQGQVIYIPTEGGLPLLTDSAGTRAANAEGTP